MCENKHLFISRINDITSHSKPTWCPFCKNKTEYKLLDFLKDKFNVVYQFKTKWCINKSTNIPLPFDFYIKDLNLIIELDGKQHFNQVSNWRNPEITQSIDIYKMNKVTLILVVVAAGGGVDGVVVIGGVVRVIVVVADVVGVVVGVGGVVLMLLLMVLLMLLLVLVVLVFVLLLVLMALSVSSQSSSG